ncbi:MAG: ATP-binding protein [Pseudomonadota bacterium]
MLYAVFPGASIARAIVMGFGLLLATISYAAGIHDGDTRHIFDGLATAILFYMVVAFLKHARRQSENNLLFERDILSKTEELKRANANLIAATQRVRRLAKVAEDAQDMVIIVGADGKIEWVNEAFVQSTGFAADEVIGESPGFLNSPKTDEDVIERLVKAQLNGLPCRADVLNLNRKGEERWVEVNQTPIFSESGELECTVSVERDISVAKEREAELARAREEAENTATAKTAFLATMSHEIRTPMNGVLGMADLLVASELNSEQRVLVDTITESGQALLTIINDILDYTKLEAGKYETALEPFSPAICAKRSVELIRPLALKKGIGFQFECPFDESLGVSGDDGRVRQILLNLLGNAVKFTKDGEVKLTVDSIGEGAEHRMRFRVRDSGIGIAQDRVAAIFDAFSQAESSTSRRFGGTGLGLSISQKLAQAMGGEISLTSEFGVGSEFVLDLPLPQTKLVSTSQSQNVPFNSSTQMEGCRVLVAEDNRTNRLLIEKYLKPTGLDVHFAEDGEIAIEKYQSLAPDLILMDVSMPRKDGLEATRAIRAWEEDAARDACPIIALTANAFEDDRKACIEAGMTGFLTKPVSRKGVIEEIQLALQFRAA